MLIIGGSALSLVSLAVLIMLVGSPRLQSEDCCEDAAPMPTSMRPDQGENPNPGIEPDPEVSPGSLTADGARALLLDYASRSDSAVAADLYAIDEVIDDQGALIAQLQSEIDRMSDEILALEDDLADAEKASPVVVSAPPSAPASDATAGLGVVISISGAVTGAVAAVAGVVSALAAMGYRRASTIRPPTAS